MVFRGATYVARSCLRRSLMLWYAARKVFAAYCTAKLRRRQMRAVYFSVPAIRSLRSIPFNSVLKAGGLSHAGTERAWRGMNW